MKYGYFTVLALAAATVSCDGGIPAAPDGALGEPSTAVEEGPSGAGVVGAETPAGDPAEGACVDFPAQRIVKLSDRQYANTVRALFIGQVPELSVSSPGSSPLAFLEDLAKQSISDSLGVQYQRNAEKAAAAVEQNPALAGFDCGLGDAVCRDAWVERFVSRAFRRPLVPAELADYQQLFASDPARTAAASVGLVVEAALQSPGFLYRTEFGSLQPGSQMFELTPHELASQLSYWLLDSPPDDELWQAANTGQLGSPEALGVQAERLIASAAGRATITAATLRWLGIAGLTDEEKDAEVFPEFAVRRGPLLESATKSIDAAFWGTPSSFRELFRSTEAYVNDQTAPVFGITTPLGADFERVQQPTDERLGILTHPAVMAHLAGASETKVVHRGLLVRRELLCQVLPAPPEGLDTDTVGEGLTQREFAAVRGEDAACSGCHQMIDPIGLLFESYDAEGAFQTDLTESLPAESVIGTDFDGEYSSAVALAASLADSNALAECATGHFLSLAMGQQVPSAGCSSSKLSEGFVNSGTDIRQLVGEIARSEIFRTRTPGVNQ